MIIVYEKGIMIVTHSSGHIDNYTIEDMELVRDMFQQDASLIAESLLEIDNYISLIAASVGVAIDTKS